MNEQQRLLDDFEDLPPAGGPPDDGVPSIDIADRMERSFLDYSMSVIVGRALPDVRDGLKPVQRRILYAMWEAGLRPERPYRKCASAVGDVMKKYHPHGDSSIYEAMVRMAQDFASRAPLVDGHGNFGSIDGDAAAAMRYTEARLSPLAMELLEGTTEDTVDYVDNYDGYETEPVVLPARWPNLLVNGAAGIAVGMATSIPPHNLGEAIEACLLLLERPAATVDELRRVLPGPDFPTGGRVVGTQGIRDAYLTGKGVVTMEAVATTETRSGGLPRIVVTELPYQVNKSALLERIAELVRDRKIEAIRDLRDESSRDGIRVVIELKRGEQPARVLERLFTLTDLRSSFHVNAVALVAPERGAAVQPRTVGLRDLLDAYLDHQREVLTRRTTHRRDKAAARVHVLEGLLTALDHLDEVIALIRAADDVESARAQLQERFALSEVQATAILDMQLRRLAALERAKLADEHRELVALIEELEAILADEARLDELLATELRELRATHADERRTRIVEEPETAATDEAPAEALPELAAQEVTVYVTTGGYLKAVGRRRTSKAHSHPKDPLAAVLRATTDDVLLAVDADGAGYRVALGDVPVMTMRQRGTTIAQLLGDGPSRSLAGAVVLPEEEDATLLTVSAAGLVKRTAVAEFAGRTRSMVAAGVRDDDELVAVRVVRDDDDVLLAHDGGQVIRFAAADVRPIGRSASGVAGMQVPAGARIVSATVLPGGVDTEAEVVTVGVDGAGKRAPASEYPRQGRGGKGVTSGTDAVAWVGVATDLHVPVGDSATVVRSVDVPAGRRGGRSDALLEGPVTGGVAAESAGG